MRANPTPPTRKAEWAAVWDVEVDNYDKHIADTLDAGDGLCDLDIVRIVVEEGPDRVREIIDWGARFDTQATDKDGDGKPITT